MRQDPISVVIPVRNEGGRIRRTIDSILRGRSCPFPLEIVVVDDASDDGCCRSLEQLANEHSEARIVVHRLSRWSGIPFARNRGAEKSRHPILVVTDGNTEFPQDWNAVVWRHLRPGRILCGTIADRRSPFRGYGCQLQLPSMGVAWIPVPRAYGDEVPIAPCTWSALERASYMQLGGYDEALPVYGAAEPEFSVRAWLSGYQIVQIPDLVIWHRFRPPAEFEAYRARLRPLLVRNYLRFACYYLPASALLRTYAHYGGGDPSRMNPGVNRLIREGVWERRAQLANLARSFEWFANRFGLQGFCNENVPALS